MKEEKLRKGLDNQNRDKLGSVIRFHEVILWGLFTHM